MAKHRPNRISVATTRKTAVKPAPAKSPKAQPKSKARAAAPARAVKRPSVPAKATKPPAARPAGRLAAAKANARARTKPSKPSLASATPAKPAPRPAVAARKAPEQNIVATHAAAMQVFERGFEMLQQRDYARACALLQSLVTDFPDEKELHDRARVYLAICERHATPTPPSPKSLEERIYSATVTINQGAYEEGLSVLRVLEGEAPEHDHVQYMLAVVQTLRGQAALAVPHLERAIELNEQNRFLASQDADLELLRQHDGVAALLEAPPHARRPAPRPRIVR